MGRTNERPIMERSNGHIHGTNETWIKRMNERTHERTNLNHEPNERTKPWIDIRNERRERTNERIRKRTNGRPNRERRELAQRGGGGDERPHQELGEGHDGGCKVHAGGGAFPPGAVVFITGPHRRGQGPVAGSPVAAVRQPAG